MKKYLILAIVCLTNFAYTFADTDFEIEIPEGIRFAKINIENVNLRKAPNTQSAKLMMWYPPQGPAIYYWSNPKKRINADEEVFHPRDKDQGYIITAEQDDWLRIIVEEHEAWLKKEFCTIISSETCEDMEEDYAEAANIFKWGKERATEKWLKYTGETTLENRYSETYVNHQNGFEHGSIEGGFKKGCFIYTTKYIIFSAYHDNNGNGKFSPPKTKNAKFNSSFAFNSGYDDVVKFTYTDKVCKYAGGNNDLDFKKFTDSMDDSFLETVFEKGSSLWGYVDVFYKLKDSNFVNKLEVKTTDLDYYKENNN